jgi:hypothetical protein
MVLALAATAMALSVNMALACDHDAQAADAKDAKNTKDAKVGAASAETKGCDMPCCAHGAAAAASDKVAANAAGEKPCAAHDKGCPKKNAVAVAAAKGEPAKDPAPQPASDAGTHR